MRFSSRGFANLASTTVIGTPFFNKFSAAFKVSLNLAPKFKIANFFPSLIIFDFPISIFSVIDARFAKPLDENLIWQLATTHEAIMTIEEGSIGGFGSHVVNFLTKKGLMDSNLKFRSLTLPDIFIDQDTPDKMYKVANLDSVSIEEKVLDLLNSNIVLKKQN